MDLSPGGYRLEQREGRWSLTLGGWTATQALSRIPPEKPARILTFGATLYQRYGWATEAELPPLGAVGEITALVSAEIGLMELEVEIRGLGRLVWVSGEDCRFVLDDRAAALEVIRLVAPPEHLGRLTHALLSTGAEALTLSADGRRLRRG